MARQDTTDFMTAFAVGTVLGVAATLLLRPQRTARETLVHELKPYRKKMRKSYGQARAAMSEGAGATSELSETLVAAGRELLGEFRGEVSRILDDAREDLQEIAQDQMKGLAKRAKKTRKTLNL
jgi:gas vesicle protein